MVCERIDFLQRLRYQSEEVPGWTQYVPVCFFAILRDGGERVVCRAERAEISTRIMGRPDDGIKIHLVRCRCVTVRHPSVRRLPRESQHSGTEGCQIDWRDWLFLLAGLQVCVVQREKLSFVVLWFLYARVPQLPDNLQTLF